MHGRYYDSICHAWGYGPADIQMFFVGIFHKSLNVIILNNKLNNSKLVWKQTYVHIGSVVHIKNVGNLCVKALKTWTTYTSGKKKP